VALRNETGASQTFALQHIGANLIQQGINKGGNALGIEAGNQQCQYYGALSDKISMDRPETDYRRVDYPNRLGKRSGRRSRALSIHQIHRAVGKAWTGTWCVSAVRVHERCFAGSESSCFIWLQEPGPFGGSVTKVRLKAGVSNTAERWIFAVKALEHREAVYEIPLDSVLLRV
jgi:hypothetical protein